MINNLLRKIFSTITITLILCSNIIITTGYPEKLQIFSFEHYGNIYYVGGDGPGNFSIIQDAINHAIDGDIVFVFSGIYYENIIVNKSISLIGEGSETTRINGNGKKTVVNMTSNQTKINGFAISYSGEQKEDAGIELVSNYCNVTNNVIINNHHGILLKNSSNNFLFNNKIQNNYYGVTVNQFSQNNTIKNNTISNNQDGIDIDSNSNFTKIIGNNIYHNEFDGIWIKSSEKHFIVDNVLRNNFRGMYLYDKTNSNNISNNLFFNDGLVLRHSFNNYLANNKVNNKSIVYVEDQSDFLIDESCGQIILVNCENITIKNQTISNVFLAIVLQKSNSCNIHQNNILKNNNGLILYHSNNNFITENVFDQNIWNSIYLSNSENNHINNNQISFTDEFSGIDLWDYSNNTTISGNYFYNNAYGVHIYKTSNTLIFNNDFSNDHYGICLWFYCFNTTIFSNKIINCRDGIWLYNTKYNDIFNNTIENSDYDGIWLYNSSYNNISLNQILNCTCGIEFAYSNFNTIKGNTLEKGGFFVYFSFENRAAGNNINKQPLEYLENKTDFQVPEAGQVILVNCKNITCENQNFVNTIIGFQLWWSDECKILNNIISDNIYGFWTIFSNFSIINNNEISSYENKGAYLYSSDCTVFSNNIISGNKYTNSFEADDEKVADDCIHFWSKNKLIGLDIKRSDRNCGITTIDSNNNYIINNRVTSNPEYGILMYNSDDSHVLNNNISNNGDGLIIENSINNNFSFNNISINDNHGLHFVNSKNNQISNNPITKNPKGILFLNSSDNLIFHNIFKNNEKNAYFEYCKNKWINNYWNRGRILPKLIPGKIKIGVTNIKWFNVDWFPARK